MLPLVVTWPENRATFRMDLSFEFFSSAPRILSSGHMTSVTWLPLLQNRATFRIDPSSEFFSSAAPILAPGHMITALPSTYILLRLIPRCCLSLHPSQCYSYCLASSTLLASIERHMTSITWPENRATLRINLSFQFFSSAPRILSPGHMT